MTNPIAAQDRCPVRLDLDRGLRLISGDPQHTRVFTQNAYGVTEQPVDPSGQPTHFPGLSWLAVNSPHAILPGIFDGPKGKATVTYYMDSFLDDMSSGYDPVFEVNALFDDLLSSMAVGGTRTFDVSVDQGSWGMFGMAFWNKSDGTFNVNYLGPSETSPHVLGSCSYEIFSYRTQLRTGNQILLHEDVHYAPELGLVLGRTPLDQDGNRHDTLWFSSIAFE